MGKFQLNKKGEDPIKIYEDAFKIAEGTVETHLDKLGKQPKPISRESDDTSRFEADIENDQLIQKLPTDKRSFNVESDGTDHDNDGDIDSKDYLKSKDIAIKSNIEEADNFTQKDFGSVNQWEDDLDELRGLGGKLPDTNALWKSVEAIANEVFSPSDEEVLEYIRNNPSQNGTGIVTGMGWDGVEETDVGIMRLIDAGKIETQNGGYVVNESYASEDMEDHARSSWDDASIEDRKNWLFVAGYDSERGDEYEPYFSLDSHIRAQLMKDLHIGGIYAMGTGSL